MRPAEAEMNGPAPWLMHVTNSITGDHLRESFILPGNIWQLKCFISRQPEISWEMLDGLEGIIVFKVRKRLQHEQGEGTPCDDNEEVDQEQFSYFFTLRPRTKFDPWKDMRLLVYSSKRWKNLNRWVACNAWWLDASNNERCPLEIREDRRLYDTSLSSCEWFFQEKCVLNRIWGIQSLDEFADLVFALPQYSPTRPRLRRPMIRVASVCLPRDQHFLMNVGWVPRFRYNGPGPWLSPKEQENVQMLRSLTEVDGIMSSPTGRRVTCSLGVWHRYDDGIGSEDIIVVEEGDNYHLLTSTC
eukprot:gnl/TRDRNA2_/TRDRNA2_175534_c0_seq2.p1 gnl/TRDRNA2_/TRDRNA2_175534_c0~~gnl/TRDRNA2_/TRDRNA2_175534_c0_seq2.p1  ORF type:complete len:300 (+),score=20.97 gnl/TRDRNA2_/TRDRNA2_175534_c0_seq2:121-1020(+)